MLEVRLEPRSVSLELAAPSDARGSWRSSAHPFTLQMRNLSPTGWQSQERAQVPSSLGTDSTSVPESWAPGRGGVGGEQQSGDPQQRGGWGAGDGECGPPTLWHVSILVALKWQVSECLSD